jgi:hypothetical protein
MTAERTEMNKDLADLQRDYRAIEAPPFLETRISARARAVEHKRFRLRPDFAVVAVAFGVLAVLPFLMPRDTTTSALPKAPSFTALARAMPSKPATPVPNLAGIRSIPVPAMPARPTG